MALYIREGAPLLWVCYWGIADLKGVLVNWFSKKTAQTAVSPSTGSECGEGYCTPGKRAAIKQEATEAVLEAFRDSIVVVLPEDKDVMGIVGSGLLGRYNITVLTPGEARKINMSKTLKGNA